MRSATEYIVLTPRGWYGSHPDAGSNFRLASPFATKLGAFRFADTIPGAQVWTRNVDKLRQCSLKKRAK